MELRAAEKKDLPALETMFNHIVEGMYGNGIKIWNEFYPYEEFAGDIENNNLYLITKGDEIAAAFGVYDAVGGKDCFEWKDKSAKAMYLGRAGVNVNFLRQGVGQLLLEYALKTAKQKGANVLRLLVSEDNIPAINLYKKNGFVQVAGVYNEFSETLNKNIVELGFEIEGSTWS